MAKKAKPSKPRQANNQIRIPEGLLHQLDLAAEQHGVDRRTEATIAIRQYLEREGYWPPSMDLASLPEAVRPQVDAFLKRLGFWKPVQE